VKKLFLVGTIVLLTATSASAQSSGPGGASSAFGGGMTGGFRSGPRLAVSPPNPRTVACLRANGIHPGQQDQHVITVAIQRCIGRGHR
jgi:hypothetical protein